MKALEGKSRSIKMVKVDVDLFPNIAEALKVSSLPTVMLFRKSTLVEQFAGVINEDECEKFIQRAAKRVLADTQDEKTRDSKFLEDEEAQSTSEVVDLASIHSKVEVALQGLAEGSSASSATQKLLSHRFHKFRSFYAVGSCISTG